MDHQSDIDTFKAITGGTGDEEAIRTLEHFHWNLNQAVDYFFENGPIRPIPSPLPPVRNRNSRIIPLPVVEIPPSEEAEAPENGRLERIGIRRLHAPVEVHEPSGRYDDDDVREVSPDDWASRNRAINSDSFESPGLGSRDDDGQVEEEMLRAAIAASKRQFNMIESGSGVDDEVTRALALSIATAQEEDTSRGMTATGVISDDEMEVDAQIEPFGVNSLPPRADPIGSGRLPPSQFSHYPEEEDGEIDEGYSRSTLLDSRPSMRRRHLDQGEDVEQIPETVNSDAAMEDPSLAEAHRLPSAAAAAAFPDPISVTDVEGISTEEQEEAKMIEAAYFGTTYVPAVPVEHFYSAPQFPRQRGLHRNPLSLFEDFYEGVEAAERPESGPLSEELVQQRLLKEEQDNAYQMSLLADREKEMKALQEEEEKRRQEIEDEKRKESQEQAARLKLEELERQLDLKRKALPSEPLPEDMGAIVVQVRMPDGSRKGRAFLKTDSMQSLFDFLDVSGVVVPGSYRLVKMFPRQPFSDHSEEAMQSFADLGFGSKEALVLERISKD